MVPTIRTVTRCPWRTSTGILNAVPCSRISRGLIRPTVLPRTNTSGPTTRLPLAVYACGNLASDLSVQLTTGAAVAEAAAARWFDPPPQATSTKVAHASVVSASDRARQAVAPSCSTSLEGYPRLFALALDTGVTPAHRVPTGDTKAPPLRVSAK